MDDDCRPYYRHEGGDIWFIEPEHGVRTLIATGIDDPTVAADIEARHRSQWERGETD